MARKELSSLQEDILKVLSIKDSNIWDLSYRITDASAKGETKGQYHDPPADYNSRHTLRKNLSAALQSLQKKGYVLYMPGYAKWTLTGSERASKEELFKKLALRTKQISKSTWWTPTPKGWKLKLTLDFENAEEANVAIDYILERLTPYMRMKKQKD